jgi:hypothetical protein
MEAMDNEAPLREPELVGLHPLAREIPNIDAAVAEIAQRLFRSFLARNELVVSAFA